MILIFIVPDAGKKSSENSDWFVKFFSYPFVHQKPISFDIGYVN